jgi:hypothetical protein
MSCFCLTTSTFSFVYSDIAIKYHQIEYVLCVRIRFYLRDKLARLNHHLDVQVDQEITEKFIKILILRFYMFFIMLHLMLLCMNLFLVGKRCRCFKGTLTNLMRGLVYRFRVLFEPLLSLHSVLIFLSHQDYKFLMD